MKYQEITTDDIDQLFTWGNGFDHEFTQLSAGRLGFRCRNVRLQDVSIEWNSFGQSFLARETLARPTMLFGLVLKGPVSVRGYELARDDGFVYHPGVEQEYRATGGTESLIIAITPSLFRRLGWNLSPQAIRRVPQPLLAHLLAVCEDATAAAVMQQNSGVYANEQLLGDRIVTALRNTLEPWLSDQQSNDIPLITPSREYRLVKRAERFIQAIEIDQKLNVPAVATELGTSERSLYESFRKWLGMGPYEFHLRCKLHEFRKNLLAGKPHHGRIMQSAHLAGFHHMGRATQAFRKLFGETPRELMKRRSLEPVGWVATKPAAECG